MFSYWGVPRLLAEYIYGHFILVSMKSFTNDCDLDQDLLAMIVVVCGGRGAVMVIQ